MAAKLNRVNPVFEAHPCPFSKTSSGNLTPHRAPLVAVLH